MDWLNWGLIAPNIEASCRFTEKTFWELTRNGWFTMIIWFNMTSYQDSLIHLNTNNHLPFVGPFSAMIHTVLGQEVLLWDCCTQTSVCSKLGTLAPRKRMTTRASRNSRSPKVLGVLTISQPHPSTFFARKNGDRPRYPSCSSHLQRLHSVNPCLDRNFQHCFTKEKGFSCEIFTRTSSHHCVIFSQSSLNQVSCRSCCRIQKS